MVDHQLQMHFINIGTSALSCIRSSIWLGVWCDAVHLKNTEPKRNDTQRRQIQPHNGPIHRQPIK